MADSSRIHAGTFQIRTDECNGATMPLQDCVSHFVTGEAGADLRAFLPDDKAHPSISLARGGPALKSGEWTEVTVELRGDRGSSVARAWKNEHRSRLHLRHTFY
jgi:hypothetical protein